MREVPVRDSTTVDEHLEFGGQRRVKAGHKDKVKLGSCTQE
jgi:hypothetical protein